jgi:hypothetical protein
MQQNLARMQLIQDMQSQASQSSLNFKESRGIPDGYMPSPEYEGVIDRTTSEQDDTNSSDDSKPQQEGSSGQLDRQQAGETARMLADEDLASMPDKDDSFYSTPPQAQAPMQTVYDAAQQMEAFRLQTEKNRMMRKKPLGE